MTRLADKISFATFALCAVAALALAQIGNSPGITGSSGTFTGSVTAGPSTCSTPSYGTGGGNGFTVFNGHTQLCNSQAAVLDYNTGVGWPQAAAWGSQQWSDAAWGFWSTGAGGTELVMHNGGSDRERWFGGLKVLTDSTPTGFLFEFWNSGPATAGGFIHYMIKASDGGFTNTQMITGTLRYGAVDNAAGTVTCTLSEVGTPVNVVTSGTITNSFTCTSPGSTEFQINANAHTSFGTTIFIQFERAEIGPSTLQQVSVP